MIKNIYVHIIDITLIVSNTAMAIYNVNRGERGLTVINVLAAGVAGGFYLCWYIENK